MSALPPGFAARVVRWQKAHGRSNLPWQKAHDPYRVWLSEIMLQQTQVSTVLDYYPRFLQRFPTVAALAAASQDDVLAQWSGLGYYSRARNLHRCAQAVVAEHGGHFPQSAAQLQTLAGIGRSTAAAIAAFCFGERVAILDANVRRVLSRVLAFGQDLGLATNQAQLWSSATELLPRSRLQESMPAYTQGVMDLGAMLCTPKRPKCPACPVRELCQAHAKQDVEAYPVKARKIKRSAQSIWLLWAHRADGSVWLARRPQTGVWAGLYCLPDFATEAAARDALPLKAQDGAIAMPAFVHVLTHRDLHLHPLRVPLSLPNSPLGDGAWYAPEAALQLGLPAPVRKLLVSGDS